ncbi:MULTISPECIES: heme-degrading domain-containing protein [unclassified Caballeronia]|uniref:heme-degrading domain-containing protein n=1 Tax=unclassified Caballeronia TaxID=2646786 RepID=UPI002028EDFB|nr:MULTISPECIES: heme-degrading domain-containing protein [unclassified Caballeronia]MDR5771338.1 heme-degrading domain-containing protein [Caballeronia sp. LZ002]MDR5846774.1 heme-degrading domain-containing protein [Caballeronia sp. LZ003]
MDIPHDLQIIAHQERALVFPQFHADEAWQTGTQLREMAMARGAVVVIDVRTFGQRMFFASLDGATPDNARWAERKARTVEHFRRSSYGLGLSLQQAGTTLADKYGLNAADYSAHGGGFPLRVANVGVIGSVTVSGLPQREDHQMVVEALCAVLGHDFAALSLGRV